MRIPVAFGPEASGICVSWDSYQPFLKSSTHLESKGQFRLPTEASGMGLSAGTGHASASAMTTRWAEYAWYDANSGTRTHPVGEKQPNAWGLYDCHGTLGVVRRLVRQIRGQSVAGVFRWTQDPQGRLQVGIVLRGGSWNHAAGTAGPRAAFTATPRSFDGTTADCVWRCRSQGPDSHPARPAPSPGRKGPKARPFSAETQGAERAGTRTPLAAPLCASAPLARRAWCSSRLGAWRETRPASASRRLIRAASGETSLRHGHNREQTPPPAWLGGDRRPAQRGQEHAVQRDHRRAVHHRRDGRHHPDRLIHTASGRAGASS